MAAIYCRTNAKGDRRWRALIRRKGCSWSQTFATKQAAKGWARKVEDDLAAGKYARSPEIQELTLSEAVDRRIQSSNLTSNSTTARRMVWWSDQLGAKRLSELTRADIKVCLDKLKCENARKAGRKDSGKPKSHSTHNRYLSALSGVLQEYVDPDEGLPYNPARGIKRLQEPAPKMRYFDEQQIQAVLDACSKSSYQRMHFLAASALVTGARRQELLTLTWDQVNVERGEAYLDPEQTKTKRARVLIWVGPGLEELRRWAQMGGKYLFPSPKDSRRPLVGLPKIFRRVLQDAAVVLDDPEFHMRWHDWRHMCGTYLAMNGCNAFMIADILGHTSTRTTQRYINLTTDSRKRALLEVFGTTD